MGSLELLAKRFWLTGRLRRGRVQSGSGLASVSSGNQINLTFCHWLNGTRKANTTAELIRVGRHAGHGALLAENRDAVVRLSPRFQLQASDDRRRENLPTAIEIEAIVQNTPDVSHPPRSVRSPVSPHVQRLPVISPPALPSRFFVFLFKLVHFS
ncbi:hypothetical protein AJ80_09975 [Polytolypa hystricis UAMH7299]|uniref:Uncharacterized protein n=1 Tax=Polytolypa hystricis (strain UAMH7299) TaxID=1447883 RepID=A0A2B7WFK4_POLH7|nr:hypothetical protein AJ80_09975 [Polytolypa hystricis UAMH7299]